MSLAAEVEDHKTRLPKLPPSLSQRLRHDDGAPLAKAASGPTPEQRLIQRITMGWTTAEQAKINEIGYDAYLGEQLDYTSLDDSELEDAIADRYVTIAQGPERLLNTVASETYGQLFAATLLRSIYSPRQLFERMTVFWTDHFNINLIRNRGVLKLVDDREVIRRHALGKFPNMLRASARSPAMLEYLTNDTNTKRHANENYARELMELHTMGADNGYTQQDVREVARAFTGWSTRAGFTFGNDPLGSFFYRHFEHDTDAKTVLGHRIPAGGAMGDGERVLDILAEHPNTAHFIAYKLTRYFWGYEPPRGLVNQVAQKYMQTGGSIRPMLRVILRKARMATATPKLKRPYHTMVSAVRALGAQVNDPGPAVSELFAAGHLPFTWAPPNGFPDSEDYWAGSVRNRWAFAPKIVDLRRPLRIGFDIPALDPSRNPTLTRGQVRGRLDRQLTGRQMSGATKSALRNYLAAGPLRADRIRDATGLALSSPEFQRY